MCEPVSIGMAAVALVGGTMAASDKAKAEGNAEDAQRRTAREQVKQMNMANANLNLNAMDSAEEARRQLTEVDMQRLRNKGTIKAAIGESMLSGNSMDRIERSVDNEASMQAMSITDNYTRDYQSIFANQVVNTENTRSALKGQGTIMKTSGLSHALGIISSGAQGASMGMSISQGMKGASQTGSNGTAKGGK